MPDNALERILEEVCHNIMGNPPYRIDEAVTQIKALLKARIPKKKEVLGMMTFYESEQNIGYNEALSDMLKIVEDL